MKKKSFSEGSCLGQQIGVDMKKWARALYQPCLPLGEDGRKVTFCDAHVKLSREAAAEGMVLLKNEQQILPLERGTRAALFGKASVDYVKGGGGSGEVYFSYARSLQDGMECKQTEGKIEVFRPLGDFYRANVTAQYAQGISAGHAAEPEVPAELLAQAKAWADVAILAICRFSEEGADRRAVEGDFYLSQEEKHLLETVTANFSKVVLVLNIGSVIETAWVKESPNIQGALLMWQAGMEGGYVAADILCGDVNPSGRLVDTFARKIEDYPSTASFEESEDYVNYSEDIYVGYRYFETIPGADEKIVYPFGYGLSYTDFRHEILDAEFGQMLSFKVLVTNTGLRAGKEVVQLYVRAPQGKLGKPRRVLLAFGKTKLLDAGEAEEMLLRVPLSGLASYDDMGKVAKSAYVMEQGAYEFWIAGAGLALWNPVGEQEKCVLNNAYSGKIAETVWTYILERDLVLERLSEKCPPQNLAARLLADGTYEALPQRARVYEENQLEPLPESVLEGQTYMVRAQPHGHLHWAQSEAERAVWMFEDAANQKVDLDTFMAQLSDEQLIDLLGGQPLTGVANTFGMGNLSKYGIPNIMTADGPAGLRLFPECGIPTTTWPCATMLACSWNEALMERIGRSQALELKENNIGIWLAPAMNIHRNPLCGRNFEYYSEDPLVSGKMAAAMTRGVQSQKIAATLKHFCCNNKEQNRKDCDSRVSERALREIYLKGFEIAVKEANPWLIMSSYNLVNGRHVSSNRELLTDILRDE